MIEIIKELKIEVSKPNIFQAVVAKQYDMNTRFIKATIVDGADVIYIPAGPTVKAIINADRPDGQSKGFDGAVNNDGTVTVPLHSWMLEIEGTVICDISIVDTKADDNKKLTTTSFTLLVEKAAYGGGDVTSDPQYDVIVNMLEACSNAKVVADEALEKGTQALELSAQANSKYDACVEATNSANAIREEIEEGGYIESLKEMNSGGKFSFWVGTQEEYDAIGEAEQNRLYIITNDTILETLQKKIKYLEGRDSYFTNKTYKTIAENASLDEVMASRALRGIIDYEYKLILANIEFEVYEDETKSMIDGYVSGDFYLRLISVDAAGQRTYSANAIVYGYCGQNEDTKYYKNYSLSLIVDKDGNLISIKYGGLYTTDEIYRISLYGLM